MKRFISGFVAGALLFGGISAFAASPGLIGQKVQGLFTIEKEGSKVADAVIINGSAYAPVRAVADATGAVLIVEGKKIIMSDSPDQVTTSSAQEATGEKTLAMLQIDRDKIVAAIEQKKSNINDLETNVIPPYEVMAKELANNGDLGKRAQESANEYKRLVEQRKVELSTLQKQLTDLDAQIAALQK